MFTSGDRRFKIRTKLSDWLVVADKSYFPCVVETVNKHR